MTLDVNKLRAAIGSREPLLHGPPPGLPTNIVAWCGRYLPFVLSPAWRVLLATLWGLGVGPLDLATLEQVCGFAAGAIGGYVEALVVAGRRSGKSAVAAAELLYVAVIEGPAHMQHLAPGQRGYVVCIAKTTRQALEVFRYARNMVERNAELADLLDGPPLERLEGGELRFKCGTCLTVMPASKASVRGFTILGAVLDEFAWVGTDEESADQDEEIASAVRFAMIAPTGAPRRRLLTISSPAGKAGMVYNHFAKYHGRVNAPVLVGHGETSLWNPSIDRALLAAEQARDPKRYRREVLAEFADAISAWCDAEVIERAAAGRDAVHLPARPGVTYSAGVDMAFKRDSAVLVIGHSETLVDVDPGTGEEGSAPRTERRFVVDVVERLSPKPGAPLDAPVVVRRFAELCRTYGIRTVLGDQFGAIPLAAEFARHGLELREETATNRTKLEHYGRLREALYAGRVSLPRHEVLLTELRQLQERITGDGNVKIGAPNRATAHDDCAAALAWCHASGATVGDPVRYHKSNVDTRWDDLGGDGG